VHSGEVERHRLICGIAVAEVPIEERTPHHQAIGVFAELRHVQGKHGELVFVGIHHAFLRHIQANRVSEVTLPVRLHSGDTLVECHGLRRGKLGVPHSPVLGPEGSVVSGIAAERNVLTVWRGVLGMPVIARVAP